MNNLEKEFIPYQQALALKELGFDEPCFGFFHEICEDNDKAGCSGKFQSMCGWSVGRETTDDLSSHDFIVIRPTFSQAFRFFREKHGLLHDITLTLNTNNELEGFYILIHKLNGLVINEDDDIELDFK